MNDPGMQFIAATAEVFRQQRGFAERAVAQLDDAQVMRADGAEDNSVAVLMKHVGGNLRSRWTEPFTTDGEKPDRDRDNEFVTATDDAAGVRAVWDRGWAVLETFLEQLTSPDLTRSVTIRGEVMPLANALQRSLAHTAQHVGQIILLAKHSRGSEWQTLSIPRGQSATYASTPPR